MLRFLTAGESHGPALTGILEGMPAGLALEREYINSQLARRQLGHGRGARMRIEKDEVAILGGVRHGLTLGSPIALSITNRDWENWREAMRIEPGGAASLRRVSVPRPGHADYQGMVKYAHDDARNVLERASARETAMRVALGSVARRLLEELDVHVASRVVAIGSVADPTPGEGLEARGLNARADASPVRCLDAASEKQMIDLIDAMKRAGDTLGGVVEVITSELPVGLGSHVHWDRRLEGRIAQAVMSLNAIKGVELGLGFGAAHRPGSEVHDPLFWSDDATAAVRRSNRSGGIDGGMTTGAPLVVRAAMKPLATLMKPLDSIDMDAGTPAQAHVERSDVCSVPAAAVIAESLVALVLADACLEKYGGDSLTELRAHHAASRRR